MGIATDISSKQISLYILNLLEDKSRLRDDTDVSLKNINVNEKIQPC